MLFSKSTVLLLSALAVTEAAPISRVIKDSIGTMTKNVPGVSFKDDSTSVGHHATEIHSTIPNYVIGNQRDESHTRKIATGLRLSGNKEHATDGMGSEDVMQPKSVKASYQREGTAAKRARAIHQGMQTDAHPIDKRTTLTTAPNYAVVSGESKEPAMKPYVIALIAILGAILAVAIAVIIYRGVGTCKDSRRKRKATRDVEHLGVVGQESSRVVPATASAETQTFQHDKPHTAIPSNVHIAQNGGRPFTERAIAQ
ncbi:hypothetical protein F5B20DRAFT_583319 [Whalleya microplaca]|nr:hypothetical protein F5B20DRAFT_583319 [Whalleya microplaca]